MGIILGGDENRNMKIFMKRFKKEGIVTVTLIKMMIMIVTIVMRQNSFCFSSS